MKDRQVRMTPTEYHRQQYLQLVKLVAGANLSREDTKKLMEFGIAHDLVFGKIPKWLMVIVRFISEGEGFENIRRHD